MIAGMMGDSMEAMLALGAHPLYALVAPVVAALALSLGSWMGLANAEEPWPFWVCRVIAGMIQLVAKGVSCTVTFCAVTMPDAVREVCRGP